VFKPVVLLKYSSLNLSNAIMGDCFEVKETIIGIFFHSWEMHIMLILKEWLSGMPKGLTIVWNPAQCVKMERKDKYKLLGACFT